MDKRKSESSACSKKCSSAVMLNLFQHLVVIKQRAIPECRCRGSKPLNKPVIPEVAVRRTRESQPLSGFTLLEVIVAIIIIGALLAFALPKYETALDKSRFSTLMPLTKSIKDAEEVFYIASNQYTEDVSSLDVKVNPGETVQVSVKDDDDYSYVQAIDPRIENIYKAYLKHSTNFPEERHCEALTDSTRAKKVCETLGGTLLDESGEYTVYVLEGTGHGTVNTEKQCEGAEPETTQTCASGCGTQTRSVSCDTSTGEWDLGEWTGTCPEQGDTTQSCTSGVGTETRTFNCQGNTWVAGEWDKSSCTCDPTGKPAETQTCTTGVGTETRTVTCNGTTWEAGAWDTSSCTCDENTRPETSRSCQVGTGTETREVTCNGTNWTTGEWDTSDCGCDPDTEPSTEQTCSSGCGTQTRTNSCVNGQWVEGKWDTSACAGTKPATSQNCSTGCGTQSRTVTCTNGAWSTGSWSKCPSKPSASKSCSSISSSYTGGSATTTVTCNGSSWTTGTWNTANCCTASRPAKIEDGDCCYYYVCSGGTWKLDRDECYVCLEGF